MSTTERGARPGRRGAQQRRAELEGQVGEGGGGVEAAILTVRISVTLVGKQGGKRCLNLFSAETLGGAEGGPGLGARRSRSRSKPPLGSLHRLQSSDEFRRKDHES